MFKFKHIMFSKAILIVIALYYGVTGSLSALTLLTALALLVYGTAGTYILLSPKTGNRSHSVFYE